MAFVVTKSKGKQVVKKKAKPPVKAAYKKQVQPKPVVDVPTADTNAKNNPPDFPTATQPVAVAPTRVNPFRKQAATKEV